MKTDKNNFLYRLSSLRKAAFTFLEAEMEKSGIKDIPPSFGDIMYIIHELEDGYVSDIVERSYKDKSTVSNIINQLVKKGYVKKIPDNNDGRRVKIKLTERSLEFAGRVGNISKSLQERLFSDMSVEEQSILFKLITKVEKNIR